MIVRTYYPSDLDKLSKIHEQFYKDEFPLSDYFNHPVNQIVVTDGDDIICAAATREILELVAITNKNFSVRQRRAALLNVLQVAGNVAQRTNFNQLHAFIQDGNWKKYLDKYGFKPTKGDGLVLKVEG